MPLLDILDHGHLKLARQADDGGGGQEGQRHPARPEDVTRTANGLGRDIGEDVSQTAGHAPHGEDADRDESEKLDDRLEGDGGDHPVMALVGVQVPGAEQNGWILAISVQSKNGFEQSDTAVSAMVDDVLEQQPIDTERLYASGFSGGARMAFATAEAYKKKDFAGILPCGAGGARASLWKGTDIYGLCGSNCFNRWDMACTKKTLSNEYYLWFFPGAHAWAGPVDIADGITWLNGRYLKKARLNKPLIGEKHRYVKGVLSTIGAIIDKDPERAYRLTTTLKHTGVQPYYKNDLTAYVQQLKAMPALRDYAQAEAAMHALADKYFATNVMDFRNNNCPPQLTAAAAALATQYKGLKIAETIERMGGKTQIP